MTKVSSEIRIDAPRLRVWDVLAALDTVSTWVPGVINSFYTSQEKEGVGASRQCDFPDGGHVIERATEWKPGEGYTLDVHEGTVPFGSAHATFTLKDDRQGTAVTLTLEYELKPDVPGDPQEMEQQNRELLPAVLAALKHYVETGRPMPMPGPA